jgi:type IV secretory pathway TraG/TraD family ATPase VirD4
MQLYADGLIDELPAAVVGGDDNGVLTVIFLTSTEEAEQEALRPLHSLWKDLLVLRLLSPAKAGQKRAWFVIVGLATLQRLPQFHTALTKGRKSNNPIIFGYQGESQLEVIYGHLAEVMLSQPATRIIMKTGEPKAAKWASELIGEIEIERVRETVADGKRAGKSFMMDMRRDFRPPRPQEGSASTAQSQGTHTCVRR